MTVCFKEAISNAEIVSCFGQLAKDKILQPYRTQKEFRTGHKCPQMSPFYVLYVFDLRHHQEFPSAQPKKARFGLRLVVPAATILIEYVLFLTDKKASTSIDGQKK